MVEVINDTKGLVDQLFPLIMDKLEPIMIVIQAVGVALIVYIIYLIFKAVGNYKHRKRIKKIEKRVNDIDSKLDLLLEKHKSAPKGVPFASKDVPSEEGKKGKKPKEEKPAKKKNKKK